MSRKKITPFKAWQTTHDNGIEKRYIRIGDTQLTHAATRSLKHISFRVYVNMLMESGGKSEFTFPRSVYRSWCSNDGFQNAIKELTEKGFIEVAEKNKNRRIANVYRFSDRWKDYTNDTT